MKTFINHTNHPYSAWGAAQRNAAEEIGTVVDFPFPEINPESDTGQITDLVFESFEIIRKAKPEAVLCQGEATYVFKLVTLLKQEGIKVFAACSKRKATEKLKPDGTVEKISEFCFVRFREY